MGYSKKNKKTQNIKKIISKKKTIKKINPLLIKNNKITIQDLKIMSLPQKNSKSNNLVFINSTIKDTKSDELILKLNLDKIKV